MANVPVISSRLQALGQTVQATSARLRVAAQSPELRRMVLVLGALGSVLGSIMYLALLEVAWSNWSGHAPIVWQPLASLVNALVWSAYGYLIANRFIWLPNALGALVAVLTLLAAL